jgi:hypothetical protein
MNTFTQQELDLVIKTQESLEHYDGEYTVSILFDWMRILHIPQNRWLRKVPNREIDQTEWGIAPDAIRICRAYNTKGNESDSEDYSVRNVAKHIRNSAIRYWVTYFPFTGEIETMGFRDWTDERMTFEMIIRPKTFRAFLLRLTKVMLLNH